ncbi:class II aldolase/adducin family protein [Thermovibrio sp.]
MLPFLKERLKLIETAKVVFELGLTDSHGGNLSCRVGDYIVIKRSGKSFALLKPEDFVITTIDENPQLDKYASLELLVHRSIYRELNDIKAVLHAHSPFTVACSLVYDEIEPLDSESSLLFGGNVPVLSAKEVVSSKEVAEKIPSLLKKCPVCVVKGHGPFAVGETIEEALKYLSALENSCKILTYHSLLRRRGVGL